MEQHSTGAACTATTRRQSLAAERLVSGAAPTTEQPPAPMPQTRREAQELWAKQKPQKQPTPTVWGVNGSSATPAPTPFIEVLPEPKTRRELRASIVLSPEEIAERQAIFRKSRNRYLARAVTVAAASTLLVGGGVQAVAAVPLDFLSTESSPAPVSTPGPSFTAQPLSQVKMRSNIPGFGALEDEALQVLPSTGLKDPSADDDANATVEGAKADTDEPLADAIPVAHRTAVFQDSQYTAADPAYVVRGEALPQGLELIHPVAEYRRISSPFGWRQNPTSVGPAVMFHVGQDYAAPAGTPIRAAADGVVSHSGWRGTAGNRVDIQHAGGVLTGYSHNQMLLVEVGDKVKQGDLIALMGSTGNSTGPHLHFEVKIGKKWSDPAAHLPSVSGQPAPLTAAEVARIKAATPSRPAPSTTKPEPETPLPAEKAQKDEAAQIQAAAVKKKADQDAKAKKAAQEKAAREAREKAERDAKEKKAREEAAKPKPTPAPKPTPTPTPAPTPADPSPEPVDPAPPATSTDPASATFSSPPISEQELSGTAVATT
ncbi:M23 family metallopeptidase (plasmid) [Citricoccus nitrophenolicus]